MTCDAPACDVQVDPVPRTGQQNMDRDEQLLAEAVADSSRSVVRIYRWCEPTVSVGYFQRSDDQIDPRLTACPRVRRITGGGAILHDQEWTYSCVLPISHPLRTSPLRLYEVVHRAVIDLLQSLGVTSRLRADAMLETTQDAKPTGASASEPFLCFLRSDPRDVVLNGHKILGSAQRRRRGTILQHGSILMRASALTPEVIGICDLHPEFDERLFSEQLPVVLGAAVSLDSVSAGP